MRVWVFKYNTLPPNSLLPALLFEVRRRTARFSLNRKRFRQKTKPPVAIAANHRANQLRYEENTGCRWERAPPPTPTCTWQTIPAVTHLLPNLELILPVGFVVLIAGTA